MLEIWSGCCWRRDVRWARVSRFGGLSMTRSFALFSAAALAMALAAPVPATAADFITFTDSTPNAAGAGVLFTDTLIARPWSQTIATSNVSVSAVVVGGGTFNWWITDAVGQAATASNVLYSGSGTAPNRLSFNYNLAMTQLLTGGNFDPGTYFLVMGNSSSSLFWEFPNSSDDLDINPAFSLSGALIADSTGDYRSTFESNNRNYIIQISGDVTAAVPEPATWAMMVLGFGLAGGAMRARRRTKVRYSPA